MTNNRIESSVTSLSWIPSEAVTGLTKSAFEAGFTHYDDPPPDRDRRPRGPAPRRPVPVRQPARGLDRRRGRPGRGRRLLGRRRHRARRPCASGRRASRPWRRSRSPTSRNRPRSTGSRPGSSRPSGGRTGVPAPRRVNHPPFVQFNAPIAWTALALEIDADGTSSFEVVAVPAPSHGTGSTTPTACSRPRSASPTSRSGGATRSGSTRRGARRPRPRSVTAVETAPGTPAVDGASCAAARSRRSGG